MRSCYLGWVTTLYLNSDTALLLFMIFNIFALLLHSSFIQHEASAVGSCNYVYDVLVFVSSSRKNQPNFRTTLASNISRNRLELLLSWWQRWVWERTNEKKTPCMCGSIYFDSTTALQIHKRDMNSLHKDYCFETELNYERFWMLLTAIESSSNSMM